jgi:hypothetical protein
MGNTPPLRAPPVPSLQAVRASGRSGSQRLCEAYLLGPRHRPPGSRNGDKKGRELRVRAYSADSDCDGLGLEVIVKSDKEPWVHGWDKEVKHPMVPIKHDYSEDDVNSLSHPN